MALALTASFLSGVGVLVLASNEVGQSLTGIQSRQMALCLNPSPNISSLQPEVNSSGNGGEYEMSLVPTISELHRCELYYNARLWQTFHSL